MHFTERMLYDVAVKKNALILNHSCLTREDACFFSIPVCHHTHIGSEEKSRFSFLCSYLALIFFNSFELFLGHFQSASKIS